MADFFEMKFRKTGETVRVYAVSVDNNHSFATIYRPSIAGLGNPANGWETVKMASLIPLDFWVNDNYCTKTTKNKIKSRLKLISAEWQCTDGSVYSHEFIEDAIAYEAKLMGEELNEKKEG